MVLNEYLSRYVSIFVRRLPRKPYATDDLARGVKITPAEKALKKRYIQVGRYPHAIFRIVVDVDHPGEWWWDRMEELSPSLIVVNPENKHAHVIYELLDPVPVAVATQKTMDLVADVEAMAEAYFAADPGYTGLLARNPVWWATHHPDHVLGGGKLWTLESLVYELRHLLPHNWKTKSKTPSGYGRNVTLFDEVRHFAYTHVEAFRRRGDFEGFRSFLEAYARAENWVLFKDHPKGPLLDGEIRHIVKSVSKWTWENYEKRRVLIPTSSTGRPDRSRLSHAERAVIPPLPPEAQVVAKKEGGRKVGEARRKETREKLAVAYSHLLTQGAEITVSGLAREAGVSRQVARKWLEELKR